VLTDDDLARLASQLLAEVDERRSLILTSRSFAPEPRTVSSLATQLRVTEQRIRQIEASALQQLARASANSQYAPLRWRSATITHTSAPKPGEDASMPPWIPGLLMWLARWPEVTPAKNTRYGLTHADDQRP
jgi:hypothetical protein